MKSIDKIPSSKIERASKLVATGAKVGTNYLKYYGNRITKGKEVAEQKLQEDNASDIYDGLQELKGSALKFAQMLSMDQGILPKAYVDKFSLSQFSVPPLSFPLVEKTFRSEFGRSTADLFEEFETTAIHAASIGQVHKAKIKGKTYAVKIQYPGVGASVESDLSLVKPFALKMLKISAKEIDVYFNEVKNKLLEETDYENELKQGVFIKEACENFVGITVPNYYPKLSSKKILTMDYMEGIHLSEFSKSDASAEDRNIIAQKLWDFYMHQIHSLKLVHADPHPGNFLVNKNNELIVLDFGCMKLIPDEFYTPYFELIQEEVLNDDSLFTETLRSLEILKHDDSLEEIRQVSGIFKEVLLLITQPFRSDTFDFGNPSFIAEIRNMANEMMNDNSLKKQDANRGSKHFIYMNRMFFGLYNLLMDLNASSIKTKYLRI